MNRRVDLKNFIMSIGNVLDDKICDDIVSNLIKPNNNFNGWASKGSSLNNFSDNTNTEFRLDKKWDGETVLRWVNQEDTFSKILKECLNLYIHTFITNCAPFTQEGTIDYSGFNFQETPISGGFHNWHSENNSGSIGIKSRFLAWSLFLNDVEEGGELEFLNYSMRIKPKKGCIVLFPAYFTHAHRGNPPISNTKYIATGWYRHFLFDA
jgi:hypothetical protein